MLSILFWIESHPAIQVGVRPYGIVMSDPCEEHRWLGVSHSCPKNHTLSCKHGRSFSFSRQPVSKLEAPRWKRLIVGSTIGFVGHDEASLGIPMNSVAIRSGSSRRVFRHCTDSVWSTVEYIGLICHLPTSHMCEHHCIGLVS